MIRFEGAGSDPDGDPNLHYRWDFGDGSSGVGQSVEHIYANNGVYTVKLTVTDGHGASATVSAPVTVMNVAPSVQVGSDATLREGQVLTREGGFTDPGADTWTATVDYGDGSGAQSLSLSGKNFRLNYTYSRSGQFTVTVRVRDSDGAVGTGSFLVVVDNVAPQVLGAAAQVALEELEQAFALGEFVDAPGDGPWRVSVDWGDGSGDEFVVAQPGLLAPRPHRYAVSGSYAVRITVRDRVGVVGQGGFAVMVRNAPPRLTLPTPPIAGPVHERTEHRFNLGSFTDSAHSGPWVVTVDWGDGKQDSWTKSTAGALGERAHTYAEAGSYTLMVTVRDREGAAGQASFQVAVAKLAPTVTPATSQQAREGVEQAFLLGSLEDANGDGPWDVTVVWGDGQRESFTVTAVGALGSRAHVYGDNGDYTVQVLVTDRQGEVGSAAFSVVVANVAPVVTPPADRTVAIGVSHSFELGSFVDVPGDGPWRVTVDWGDGQSESFTTAAPNSLGLRAHTYTEQGARTVRITVKDKDQGQGSASFTVTANNEPPTVTPPAEQTAKEGETKSFQLGSFTDASGDGPWSVTVNWGDGQTESFTVTATGSLGNRSHTYVDDDSYTVSVSVRDQAGAEYTATFQVIVVNVPPVGRIIEPASGRFATVGQTVALSGQVSDPGVQDQLSAEWWLTSDTDEVRVGADLTAAGQVTGTYTFQQAGRYSVKLRVSDGDGGVWESTTTGDGAVVVHVFSVHAGRVTGGGQLDNGTEKPIVFRIQAQVKAKNGKLKGNINITDKTTGLKLVAKKLETVAFGPNKMAYVQARGKFKKREYRVVAVVWDGQPDRVRLKVTDIQSGDVVLDTNPGAPDAAPPTMPLARGALIVKD